MAGLDNIINEILNDAKASAREITDQAKKEADEILAAARAEADSAASEISKKSDNDVKTVEERAKSSADMQKRQAVLKMKQEVISDVIEEAHQRMVDMDIDSYFDLVEKMLKSYARAEKGELFLNERDRGRMPAGFTHKLEAIAKEKGGELILSSETRKIDGGFVLSYGGIEENCSIGAMFSGRNDELVDAVNAELFS